MADRIIDFMQNLLDRCPCDPRSPSVSGLEMVLMGAALAVIVTGLWFVILAIRAVRRR